MPTPQWNIRLKNKTLQDNVNSISSKTLKNIHKIAD